MAGNGRAASAGGFGALLAAGLILVAGCGSGSRPAGNPSSTAASPSSSVPPSPSTVTKTVAPSSAPPAAPAPADFATDYAREHNGVVRILKSACAGEEQGSGFLVAPDMVATAAHVVDGETALSIVDPVTGGAVAGQVVGFDAADDVALVRTQTSLTGHVFTFASGQPQVGSPIAAIGYPLNGPESFAAGSVSGLDRSITVQSGQALSGLIQTETPINPGNSGGPMIVPDGSVAGITDAGNVDAQGINYAVSATRAAPLVSAWRQNPSPVPATTCQAPVPTPTPTPTRSPSAAPSKAIDDAVAALIRYLNLINAQDFPTAYALLTPAGQHRVGSESQWAQGLAGSAYTNPQVVTFQSLPGGGFDVEVTFTSTQPGQSCKNWDLDYHLLPDANGDYLIDIALPHNGGSGFTPC